MRAYERGQGHIERRRASTTWPYSTTEAEKVDLRQFWSLFKQFTKNLGDFSAFLTFLPFFMIFLDSDLDSDLGPNMNDRPIINPHVLIITTILL